MNPLLHKETGDKDTERRGKYLKKLFGANVLGQDKTLLHKKGVNKESLMFQNAIEDYDGGVTAAANSGNIQPINREIGGHSAHDSKPKHAEQYINDSPKRKGDLKLHKELTEAVMDSREILFRQIDTSSLGGEGAGWVLDSLEQETLVNEKSTIPVNGQGIRLQTKAGINTKYTKAVITHLPQTQQRLLINATHKKQLKQIQMKEAQLVDYNHKRERLPHLHGSVPRNQAQRNYKTTIGFHNQGMIEQIPGQILRQKHQNHQTPLDHLTNLPGKKAVDIRNSNTHFHSRDSASLSHRSNEYLKQVSVFENPLDVQQEQANTQIQLSIQGQKKKQGSIKQANSQYESTLAQFGINIDMQPNYVGSNDVSTGLGASDGYKRVHKLNQSVDFTLSNGINTRYRSPFNGSSKSKEFQMRQTQHIPKGTLQPLNPSLNKHFHTDQSMMLEKQGNLNMSVDFAKNMDIAKNYMRLTTSVNKRYQTSVQSTPQGAKGVQNVMKMPVSLQHQKLVRRIDQYGNTVNEHGKGSIQNFPFIGDPKFNKSQHLTNKEAQLDKLKFFSKFKPEAGQQENTAEKKSGGQTGFMTASNHYKYNRLREGGWGKAPVVFTPKPVTDKISRASVSVADTGVVGHHISRNFKEQSIRGNIIQMSRRSSVQTETAPYNEMFDRTGNLHQVRLQDGSALEKCTQSIFESKASGDLVMENIKKNTMLQDSIQKQNTSNEMNPTSGLRVFRSINKASVSQNYNAPFRNDIQTQSITVGEGDAMTNRDNIIKAMVEYNSKGKGKNMDTLTVTLNSSKYQDNSQYESVHVKQIEDQNDFQISQDMAKTAQFVSNNLQQEDNHFGSNYDSTRTPCKIPTKNKYNSQTADSKNVDVRFLLENMKVIQSGNARNQIKIEGKNETMAQTYSAHDFGGVNLSDIREASHRNQRNCQIPKSKTQQKTKEKVLLLGNNDSPITTQKAGKDMNERKSIERKEKQSIFEKITASDTNKLKHSFAHQESQWGKHQTRKQRETLEKQIKEMQQALKDKRKEIQKQQVANIEERNALDHQFEVFQRLNQLEVNNTINLETHRGDTNRDLEQHFNEFGNNTNNNSIQVTAHDTSIFDGYSSDIIQQYQNPFQLPCSQINQNEFQAPSTEGLNVSRTHGVATTMTGDIRGMYKVLFENDLKVTKQKTLEQLEFVREQNNFRLHETEGLKLNNYQLRRFINRYQKMIGDIRSTNDKDGDDSEFKLQRNKDKLPNGNMDQLFTQLYKYQPEKDRQQGDTLISSRSPGHNVNNRGATAGGTTAISFGVGRPQLSMDIRKAEQISIGMPAVFRQTKPLDSLVLQLQMVKNVFKADKVTLFVIDEDYQDKIFNFSRDRKHNYKKVQVASSFIYAVFAADNEFQLPLFRDILDIHQVFNSQHIMIPIQEPGQKTPCICLQIAYGNKSASKKDNGKKSQLKKQGRGLQPQLRNSVSPDGRENSSASRGSLSTQNRLGQIGNQAFNVGWNQNDLTLMKILTNLMHMNTHYFVLQVIKMEKMKKQREIITIGCDFITAKTYRQILRCTKTHMESLIGFQDCTLFFAEQKKGSDLFTVSDTQSDEKDTSDKILGFVKDLYLSEDTIVMFPSSMGITGEVHNKKSIKLDNTFGQLITNAKDKDVEADFDIQSERSISSATVVPRRQSLGLLTKTSKLTPMLKLQAQHTELEQIIEDHPQAENELPTHLQPRHRLSKKNSVSHFQKEFSLVKADDQSVKGQIIIESNEETFDEPSQKLLQGATPLVQSTADIDFANKQKSNMLSHRKIDKKELDHGNILDLAPKKKNKQVANGSINKGEMETNENEEIYANFVPDIDNFEGWKNINNYCLVSMKDNGYNLGEASCGVLQVFNKTNGKKIDKEDLARIKYVSNFLGSLSAKASVIKNTLTMVIGMVQDIETAVDQSSKVYNLFNIHPQERCKAPMCSEFEDTIDIIKKQVSEDVNNLEGDILLQNSEENN